MEEFLECFEPTTPPMFEGYDATGESCFVTVSDEVAELIERASVVLAEEGEMEE